YITGGVGNRVEITDNALLHTASITIAAWVNSTSNNNTIHTIVDKPLGTGQADSWHFGLTPAWNYSSWFFNDPGSASGSQVIAPAATGEWHYVVATFSNTTKLHKLYVDGVLRAINTFSSTIGYDNNKMYIGAALENNGLNFPMDGVLDEIKIYDDTLAAQQIANDYAAAISYNNPGSGNALYFNGTQDNYVQLPSLLNGTNIFTTDFWVKTTDNGTNPTFWQNPMLLGNINPVSPDGDFGITLNNGQIGAWSGICSCGDQVLQTTKTINDDKWHHVAAVSDGSSLVLYVDGVLLPGSISTAGGTLQTAERPWFIGRGNSCCSNGAPANATIDELRIWNVALTQAQIRDRMCKKIDNSDALNSNLLACYHFNEISGTAVIDSKNANIGYLNLAARVTSGAPVGNASAHDYVNTVKTTTISHASGESFAVTSSSGNPDGIQVYRVDEQPQTLSGTISLGTMSKYFGVFQVGGTSPVYSAVYNYTGNAAVTAGNESSLVLYKRADNSVATWTNGTATLDMAANTLTLTGQSTEYILGSASSLPLQLLSFTASRQGANALLQWQTTDEVNTSYFEPERSNDAVAFGKIGTTAAVNSNGTHSYSFTDNMPAKGVNYYRLKQVDRDGRYTYSPIVKVIFESNGQKLNVYPNPAKNIITIAYTGNQKTVRLTIFDGEGRQVMFKELYSGGTLQADVSALAKGVYTVQLNDGVKQSFEKFVKL
ncbi:MAG: T9SS type A sorting domain-containing protein, partial [Bacteroidetes bacterium]|nr:T9SS type A sorting domain-containing protein [Bacteroidota bacterium]